VTSATGRIRLPVKVVLQTLIVDSQGQVVADTAVGDWDNHQRQGGRTGRLKGPVSPAARNAEELVRLINLGWQADHQTEQRRRVTAPPAGSVPA
jgi:hypothetical protein